MSFNDLFTKEAAIKKAAKEEANKDAPIAQAINKAGAKVESDQSAN